MIDEKELKDLVKAAVAEALVEQRVLVKEIVEEAIEEIALVKGFIDGTQMLKLIAACAKTEYGAYLQRVYQEHQETISRPGAATLKLAG